MTLHELEVMVRRIEDALQRPQPGPGLSRLAQEYQNHARAAANRLNQCSAMLAAGDEHQALQLAETAPALLDQLTLLSFRRSPQWLAICRGENLPAPDSFDVKAIRNLNDLYAKGIDKDHALYRDYRRAVMLNDDVRALGVLRSIVRLNPNDKNAKGEHDRLEQKLRADKLRQLESLVRARPQNPAAISELANELERAGVTIDSADAQSVRATFLLNHAEAAKASNSWNDFERAFDKLRPLAGFLNSEARATLDGLEVWAEGERLRRREQASRRAAIDELAALTTRLDRRQGGSLNDLRESLDHLERAWRHVEHFRIDVSPALAAQVHKHRDQLQSAIDHRLRASRRVAFAGVAGVVLICFAAAFIAYKRHANRVLLAGIEKGIAERRVSETETLLHSAGNLWNPISRQAQQFIERERATKVDSDKALAQLDVYAKAKFTNAPADKIDATFNSARDINAHLAPEFRPKADATLATLETQWQQYLDLQRTARTAQFIALLTPVEAVAARNLQYSLDPQLVSAAANSLKTQLAPVRELSRAPIPALRPKQDALFRFEQLDSRVDKFARDATNYVQAHAALNAAADLTNYLAALQLLISSGFTPEAHRAAASGIVALNLSSQTLLAPLLLPADPAALRDPHLSRYPDEALPGEREIQRRLREDENIHNISRLPIEVKTLPQGDPRRQRIVYLRGELQQRITRRTGQVYDPIDSPNALIFKLREFSSGEFTLEESTPTPEKELYDRTSLARLLDSNTGKYQVSLLQSLDDINQDRQASPIFRAWFFLQICEMIDQQPAQWSSIWSPSFTSDRANLMQLGARQIHSGDWFVPATASQRGSALVAHFDRAALHSYARESSFFKRLLPAAALEGGIRVVGYVEGNSQPIFKSANAAVWGLSKTNQSPALLFQAPATTLRHEPMPFSPLFVFEGNPTEAIDSALQATGLSAAAVGLPETLPQILRATP